MNLFKSPTVKELPRLMEKHWTHDARVLHYTGNMYGIGCRLSSTNALDRITELKNRPEKTGYIALIPDIQWLFDEEIHVPEPILPILNQYWPGNLTVVFPCSDERFASIALNGKVAFRVPADDLLRHITDILGEPLISTSINRSGLPAVTDLSEIQRRYDDWFDLGFIPNPGRTGSATEPSTIIEYIDTDEDNLPVKPYLKCLREGSIPFYEVKKSFNEPIILFMCTGNICRSPLAEYLFNYYAQKMKLPYTSRSGGLLETGSLISVNSMRLLAEMGINAQEHYSRKLNPEIMGESWLVLTMEEKQKEYIQKNFPEGAHKVFTLREYVGESGDIEDPYGSQIEYYREIFTQIDEIMHKLIAKLSPEKR